VAAGDRSARREAENELDRVVRLAPANALILNECARMQLLIGGHARALEITRHATGLYPTRGATLLMRARAEARSGDLGAAITTLRRAAASDWRGDSESRAEALAWLALVDTTIDLPRGSR
jgi:predicted Zn-dependent protease